MVRQEFEDGVMRPPLHSKPTADPPVHTISSQRRPHCPHYLLLAQEETCPHPTMVPSTFLPSSLQQSATDVAQVCPLCVQTILPHCVCWSVPKPMKLCSYFLHSKCSMTLLHIKFQYKMFHASVLSLTASVTAAFPCTCTYAQEWHYCQAYMSIHNVHLAQA